MKSCSAASRLLCAGGRASQWSTRSAAQHDTRSRAIDRRTRAGHDDASIIALSALSQFDAHASGVVKPSMRSWMSMAARRTDSIASSRRTERAANWAANGVANWAVKRRDKARIAMIPALKNAPSIMPVAMPRPYVHTNGGMVQREKRLISTDETVAMDTAHSIGRTMRAVPHKAERLRPNNTLKRHAKNDHAAMRIVRIAACCRATSKNLPYCGWPLSFVPIAEAAFAADAPFRCAALSS